MCGKGIDWGPGFGGSGFKFQSFRVSEVQVSESYARGYVWLYHHNSEARAAGARIEPRVKRSGTRDDHGESHEPAERATGVKIWRTL